MLATPRIAAQRFERWGTHCALLVADDAALDEARAITEQVLGDVGHAANRFDPTSELCALNAAAGRGPFLASETLIDLVSVALEACSLTDGACDPTVLEALVAGGYDRDIEEIRFAALQRIEPAQPCVGASGVRVDRQSHTIELDDRCRLDLGATAKARAADLAATRVHATLGVACLVDLGGDLRVAGPDGATAFDVGIAADAAGSAGARQIVAVRGGGLASSSTQLRRWRLDGTDVHHVIDPATGASAPAHWALVSVAAPTCASANALSTAAIVWGEDAIFEIAQRGAAARLERLDGTVEFVGGWPEGTSS